MKNYLYIIFLGVCGIIFMQSCDEGTLDANPFVENVQNQDTVTFEYGDVDPNSIAGIYQNVFGATCANIGCHDGTFEPDFRSLESSYYSLVYQIPIKNDGSVDYRVSPGNLPKSALIKRLEGTISPSMPIEVEPDSDWNQNKDQYIQNIRNWIENGALDVMGNSPQEDVFPPKIIGAGILHDGEWMLRQGGYGPLLLDKDAGMIDLYLAFDPDNNPENFSYNQLMFSTEIDSFLADTTVTLNILANSYTQRGFYGENVEYTHHLQMNISSLIDTTDSQWFMRAEVKDQNNPITQIPTDNGLYYFKKYMSILWMD